jgi:hypothetical protein
MRSQILSLGFATLVVLTFAPRAPNDEAVAVALTVKLNGKIESAPSQVTVEFNGVSKQVPVRHGSLKLSPDARAAKSVAIAFALRDEQIRITSVQLSKFKGGTWTVLLDDKTFGTEYKWVIPKGARIRSSCIWIFEPTDGEASTEFVQGCRTKAH